MFLGGYDKEVEKNEMRAGAIYINKLMALMVFMALMAHSLLMLLIFNKWQGRYVDGGLTLNPVFCDGH